MPRKSSSSSNRQSFSSRPSLRDEGDLQDEFAAIRSSSAHVKQRAADQTQGKSKKKSKKSKFALEPEQNHVSESSQQAEAAPAPSAPSVSSTSPVTPPASSEVQTGWTAQEKQDFIDLALFLQDNIYDNPSLQAAITHIIKTSRGAVDDKATREQLLQDILHIRAQVPMQFKDTPKWRMIDRFHDELAAEVFALAVEVERHDNTWKKKKNIEEIAVDGDWAAWCQKHQLTCHVQGCRYCKNFAEYKMSGEKIAPEQK